MNTLFSTIAFELKTLIDNYERLNLRRVGSVFLLPTINFFELIIWKKWWAATLPTLTRLYQKNWATLRIAPSAETEGAINLID
ncbi:MAG: hypothetical protein DRR16_32560 [Candidatus Parabeggiatoa sp. nov. 3]|jgi:hypothetical protein|nr:MAG: hypothetical protein DRR00_00580 [Gammaproteobacteria bacterium]RKZ59294.1 MAG: hypothetical protein DRQ99_23980 [Gammaproteobacteria bacterium]RKZ73987.1 MAG: hypothetical protein DRR16_32560 [Gammaproteobacteria bacterium]